MQSDKDDDFNEEIAIGLFAILGTMILLLWLTEAPRVVYLVPVLWTGAIVAYFVSWLIVAADEGKRRRKREAK